MSNDGITVVVITRDKPATATIYQRRASLDDEASRGERVDPHTEREFQIRDGQALRLEEERPAIRFG